MIYVTLIFFLVRSLTIQIQQLPLPGSVFDAVYKLRNPAAQIDSYVKDVVRSEMPTMLLQEVFMNKDAIASAVELRLSKKMAMFGWQILQVGIKHQAIPKCATEVSIFSAPFRYCWLTFPDPSSVRPLSISQVLVTDVEPDANVKAALNSVQQAKDHRKAAKERADARYEIEIFRAQGRCEAAALLGIGISRQRQAIVDGLHDSIGEGNGMEEEMVTNMLLISQYFDALETIAQSQTTTMFLPTSVSAVKDAISQIRAGIFTPSQFGLTEADRKMKDARILKPLDVTVADMPPIVSDAVKKTPDITNTASTWQTEEYKTAYAAEQKLEAYKYGRKGFIPLSSKTYQRQDSENVNGTPTVSAAVTVSPGAPTDGIVPSSSPKATDKVGWWTVGADLPDGWRAQQTKAGRWFFVDDKSKATQWSPPPQTSASTNLAESSVDAAAAAVATALQAGTSSPAEKVGWWTPGEDLPDGWRALKTDQGRWFFVNDASKVTQWSPPPQAGNTESGYHLASADASAVASDKSATAIADLTSQQNNDDDDDHDDDDDDDDDDDTLGF